MTRPLYELAAEFRALADADDDGVDVAAQLDSIAQDIQQKGVSIRFLLLDMEAEQSVVHAEVERLEARESALKARASKLREYLRTNMERAGIDKIKHALCSISLSNGKPSVVVDNIALVPPEYVREKVERSVDKAAAYDVYKTTGEMIPGTHIEQTKRLLIK